MSLTAAIGRVRYVERSGLRFLCRAPSLATLALATGLCPKECAALAFFVKAAPDVLTDTGALLRETVGRLLTNLDERHAEVLASCCSLVGGRPGEIEPLIAERPGLALELALAVLSLCDVARVYEFSGLAALASKTVEEVEAAIDAAPALEALTGLEVAVCGVASHHGCSPMDVMRWPVEAFLMVCKAAPLLHPRDQGDGPGLPGDEGESISPQALAGMGIGFGYERA